VSMTGRFGTALVAPPWFRIPPDGYGGHRGGRGEARTWHGLGTARGHAHRGQRGSDGRGFAPTLQTTRRGIDDTRDALHLGRKRRRSLQVRPNAAGASRTRLLLHSTVEMPHAGERDSPSIALGPWVSRFRTLAVVAQELLDRLGPDLVFQAVVETPEETSLTTNDPARLKELDIRSRPERITLTYEGLWTGPCNVDVGVAGRSPTVMTITLSDPTGAMVWINAKSKEEATAKFR
jgi:hypothetical protein